MRSWKFNKAFHSSLIPIKIGNTYKVLIDRKEGGNFIGRTESDSPEVDNEVIIESPDNYLRIGDFVNVKSNIRL